MELLGSAGTMVSPVLFALLIALATGLVWMALAPAPPSKDVADRLDDYLDRGDIIEELEFQKPLLQRTVAPAMQRTLRALGNLLPARYVANTEQMLEQAGRPLGMTGLDYQGLRILVAVGLFGVAALVTSRQGQTLTIVLRNGLLGGIMGFAGATLWLRFRVRSRKHQIELALPDALDMMTIGVEAGLAFESAMVRVGDKWHNPLTEEMQRAVAEMRVGMSREEALRRMADRSGVEDLSTFVAVLVQSGNLGVSIAQVLHTQADQMRLKRRLRAEELARQAGVKMVFPLVFLIFPAMFIVILGPAVPTIAELFTTSRPGGP